MVDQLKKTQKHVEVSDEELIEMAFEALVPFANMADVTDDITIQDVRHARDVVRFLSERLTVAKRFKRP
jgi:hypothetical protein